MLSPRPVTPQETPGIWLSEIFSSWQGEGLRSGERHLFVRTAGCNLRCSWCDTPESLVRVPQCRVTDSSGNTRLLVNPVPFDVLAQIVAEACTADPALSMIAITGGEPVVQAKALATWLAKFPPPRLCLLETNAVVTRDLAALLKHIALVSADLKLPSNTGEGDLWTEHRDFLVICQETGTALYVKIPVDATTDLDDVRRAADLVRVLAPAATVFVQPLTEVDSVEWTVGDDRLHACVAEMRARAVDARMGIQLHKFLGVR
ncbi:MAG: 7-carboxy-7-deazaguanine synthase [Hyphomicrobiaceae bacterium]|jgi:7-carboxy-7-deazaguanine synthase